MVGARAYSEAAGGGSWAIAHRCHPVGYASRIRLMYGKATSQVPHVVLKKTRSVGLPEALFGREYSRPSMPSSVKCGASAPASSKVDSSHVAYNTERATGEESRR